MELERGAREQIDAVTQVVAHQPMAIPARRAAPPSPGHDRIDGETSVAVLRRCTALAARARVELLTATRRTASDELFELLGTMGEWSPEQMDAPDPTMTVLCAAALQDLAARLPDPRGPLSERVTTVLTLLHAVMAEGRIAALA